MRLCKVYSFTNYGALLPEELNPKINMEENLWLLHTRSNAEPNINSVVNSFTLVNYLIL
jgi:hypothetical protein